MTETNNSQEEELNIRTLGVPILRFMQFIALAVVAVGFIWGIGDFINSLMPANTQAPMSVLLMLYGFVAFVMIEVPVRWLGRKK
jgi:hypothetical protein